MEGGRIHRVRILHIIPHLGIGGAERQLVQLLRRMDSRRFDQAVCYYTHYAESLEGELTNAGIRTIFLDKFGMPVWRFFLKLRSIVRAESPDIVHTWLYSANFWGQWAAATAGVRRLVSSERSEIHDRVLLMTWTARLLRRRTTWLANSRAGARSMETCRGLPASSVRVIYNGVDLGEVDREDARCSVRQELNLPPEERIVLTIGNHRPIKNPEMFIRVAAQVRGTCQGVSFVSIGRRRMVDDLDSLTRELGVTQHVWFLGERTDVPRWLAGADVFCFTSFQEGFPNALLEAMHTGLPVVSTTFGSATEVIPGPDVGILVPCDDDQAMAEEVRNLLEDEERRHWLGASARSWVAERFSWDRLVDEMEHLYTEVVAKA